jgi:hypothetical protein
VRQGIERGTKASTYQGGPLMVIYGPDIFHDDPSPEDIQRAFAAEQQARTGEFFDALQKAYVPQYPPMNGGTPNEPERELSAAEVRQILQDLTEAVRLLTLIVRDTTTNDFILDLVKATIADMETWQQRLNEAPPY